MKKFKLLKKEIGTNGRVHICLCGVKIASYMNNTSESHRCVKTLYGKLFFPYYNFAILPSNKEPEIYNKDGRKMRSFFLRDRHFDYCSAEVSKYFIWDKFNIGLDMHFYTNDAMLETMGNPKHKFGMFVESESIVPEDYKIFEKHPDLYKQFDYIFTYSSKILDTIPNARFVPFAAGVWGEPCKPNLYKHKSKICSFISSDKHMCPLHEFRYNLALKCKKEHLCDTFGNFDGGPRVEHLSDTYRDYMFCICLENDVNKYYFSERLTTALANQCIPIYLGATKIDKFFNPDGIIKITTKSDIKKVLKRCTPKEYKRRLPAVLDNYKRVCKKYMNIWDFMYEEYLSDID